MKKYNLSKIMKRAWELVKKESANMSEALRKSWKEARMEKNNQLVLYTHGCKDASNHHLNKYKHWAKLVTGVDTSLTNGFAFAGKFLKVTSEHKLPVGAVVVEVCGGEIECYVMEEGRKRLYAEGYVKSMSSFIDQVAKLF